MPLVLVPPAPRLHHTHTYTHTHTNTHTHKHIECGCCVSSKFKDLVRSFLACWDWVQGGKIDKCIFSCLAYFISILLLWFPVKLNQLHFIFESGVMYRKDGSSCQNSRQQQKEEKKIVYFYDANWTISTTGYQGHFTYSNWCRQVKSQHIHIYTIKYYMCTVCHPNQYHHTTQSSSVLTLSQSVLTLT